MTHCSYTQDPALARLRVSTCLAAVDLTPSSLPPAAILLVRRFPDPSPGTLLDQPAKWEQEAQSSVSACLRRAVRPAQGTAPGNADAILFLDRGELLACFARDLLRGVAHSLWWWRAAFFRTFPPNLFAAWSPEIRHVHAAIQFLAQSGEAARAVQLLTAAEAASLLEAMEREFGIAAVDVAESESLDRARSTNAPAQRPPAAAASRELRLDISDMPALTKPMAEEARAETHPAVAGDVSSAEPRQPVGAPLLEKVLARTAIPGELPRKHAALLATAIALEHAPALVRLPIWPALVRQWLATREPSGGATAPEPARLDVSRAAAPVAGPLPESPRPIAALQRPAKRADSRSERRFEFQSKEVADFLEVIRTDRSQQMEAPAAVTPSGPPRPPGLRKSAGTTIQSEAPAPDTQPAKPSAAAVANCQAALEGIATDLGGVLFLVHVLRELDLEAVLDEDTSAWGLIERLARSMLTREYAVLFTDQIWPVLAGLDGREPRQPLAEASPRTTAVLQPVQERLRAALHQPDDLVAALLLRRGHLYVTRSHVDLVMPLDSATVPVRMAGLDCNPGWVPVLGRVITFHYV